MNSTVLLRPGKATCLRQGLDPGFGARAVLTVWFANCSGWWEPGGRRFHTGAPRAQGCHSRRLAQRPCGPEAPTHESSASLQWEILWELRRKERSPPGCVSAPGPRLGQEALGEWKLPAPQPRIPAHVELRRKPPAGELRAMSLRTGETWTDVPRTLRRRLAEDTGANVQCPLVLALRGDRQSPG